ncbi:hypothetical protein HK102_005781, partial [Quaeritorhiza haematococci]
VDRANVLPDCNGPVENRTLTPYPTTNCLQISYDFAQNKSTTTGGSPATGGAASGNSTSNADLALDACPPPLVADPNPEQSKNDPNRRCSRGCCLACPAQESFYPKGYKATSSKLYLAFVFISLISFGSVTIMALTLKSMRRHPAIWTSMCGISGTLTFAGAPFLAPRLEDTLCVDSVTRATAFNNWKTGAAAFFMILGVNLLLSYIPLLILNLHLMTVWRNNVLARFEKWIHFFVWISSMGLTAAPFALGLVGATPSVPMIMDEHLAFWILLPRAPLVFGSFLLHIITGVYLVTVSRSVNRHMKQAKYVRSQLKLQWRSMVLAAATCFTFVFFIVSVNIFKSYYFAAGSAYAAKVDQNTPWVREWIRCIFRNAPNGQDQCTDIAQRNLPSDFLTQSAISSFLLCGIWAVITVGSSTTLIREFWDTCFGRKVSSAGPSGSSSATSSSNSSTESSSTSAASSKKSLLFTKRATLGLSISNKKGKLDAAIHVKADREEWTAVTATGTSQAFRTPLPKINTFVSHVKSNGPGTATPDSAAPISATRPLQDKSRRSETFRRSIPPGSASAFSPDSEHKASGSPISPPSTYYSPVSAAMERFMDAEPEMSRHPSSPSGSPRAIVAPRSTQPSFKAVQEASFTASSIADPYNMPSRTPSPAPPQTRTLASNNLASGLIAQRPITPPPRRARPPPPSIPTLQAPVVIITNAEVALTPPPRSDSRHPPTLPRNL